MPPQVCAPARVHARASSRVYAHVRAAPAPRARVCTRTPRAQACVHARMCARSCACRRTAPTSRCCARLATRSFSRARHFQLGNARCAPRVPPKRGSCRGVVVASSAAGSRAWNPPSLRVHQRLLHLLGAAQVLAALGAPETHVPRLFVAASARYRLSFATGPRPDEGDDRARSLPVARLVRLDSSAALE